MRGVDGSILKLQNTHGFRNYVKTKAVGLKLTGWIKRVPRCDVEIVVSGDESNLKEFDAFVESCVATSICATADVEMSHKTIVGNDFVVLRSDRRYCKTGKYSNGEIDIVSVSVQSADRAVFSGSTHSSGK